MASTATLTDLDRHIIAKARQLAALRGEDAIRAHLAAEEEGTIKPSTPGEMIYPHAFGSAAFYLAELADIADRLGGDGA